jgi:hypothetical protein
MIDDGDWDLNDNQRVRRPRETRRPFQRDEQLVSQRDPRDRFVNEDRNSSRSNDRRLSDDYFDNFQRREFDDRDQRDIDYVRNRINQGRGDDYLSPNDARSRRYADEIRSIEPYSRSGRTRSDGRSSDYDTNFASQQRELQERLLVAKRLEVKNAENAAWLERQRESMEAARVARFYEDDLTPLRSGSSINDNLSTDRYSFGDERLADRSTDPNYRGRRTDALSPARSSNASAARVAQILADKEADLDAKMGAIDHLLKLDEAGRNLDSKINSIKNGNQPQNNLGGRVQS